ncbi:unnamed protein product [Miscanthus lutarioriparius]|uniref:Uncharacterized protein n=1 Tax=Miscanthus lutarioriparius TaxID=422564 RepID=A0A811RIN2_9POAL|nr:unnamed protein product [Miscanthus lutarioriparius]
MIQPRGGPRDPPSPRHPRRRPHLRAWRHRWRHLPVPDFRRCSVGRLGVVSAAQSVLLRHLAQVEDFALDGSSPPLPEADHPRLDDLLIHLSPPRHALKGLVLNLPSYKLHSSVFSCVNLDYLEVKGCLLPGSTPGLVASLPLLHLTRLRVHYTRELEPHLNSAQFDALAALISGCPGLEQLVVIVGPEVAGVKLKIAAPRLRQLEIRARSADWMVEFQSLLPDLAQAKLQLPFFCYAQEGGVEASANFTEHFAGGEAGVA